MLDFAITLSFFISIIAFFGLFLLFADSLLLRFDLKTFLKALGFAMLSAAAFFNFLSHGYIPITLWVYVISFLFILFGFVFDPNSKLQLMAPLGAVAIFLLPGHLRLVILCVGIAGSIFQLIHSTKHQDLIPLGISFVLIAIGEYFYYVGQMDSMHTLAPAGAFLYIFASILLLFWLWSYVALRVLLMVKNNS